MADKNPAFSALLKNPIHFLAFGFGSGLAPKAPGTFGTLAAVPLLVAMSQLTLPIYAAVTVAVCIIGIYLCGKTADDLGVHDHGGIVWDEFAGFFITMLPIHALGSWSDGRFWLLTAVGFALFRFFDAVKPWPISWFDKNISGGLGIMLDDIIAGLVSFGVLQALIYWGL